MNHRSPVYCAILDMLDTITYLAKDALDAEELRLLAFERCEDFQLDLQQLADQSSGVTL